MLLFRLILNSMRRAVEKDGASGNYRFALNIVFEELLCYICFCYTKFVVVDNRVQWGIFNQIRAR